MVFVFYFNQLHVSVARADAILCTCMDFQKGADADDWVYSVHASQLTHSSLESPTTPVLASLGVGDAADDLGDDILTAIFGAAPLFADKGAYQTGSLDAQMNQVMSQADSRSQDMHVLHCHGDCVDGQFAFTDQVLACSDAVVLHGEAAVPAALIKKSVRAGIRRMLLVVYVSAPKPTPAVTQRFVREAEEAVRALGVVGPPVVFETVVIGRCVRLRRLRPCARGFHVPFSPKQSIPPPDPCHGGRPASRPTRIWRSENHQGTLVPAAGRRTASSGVEACRLCVR